MRIFDPKDQLGNSLLSSADTQKSSVKLEKTMVEGEVAITLTSADISDIENWELSNASLLIEGQTYSFLPESVRNSDGSLTVDFGTEFTKAVMVLKRSDFDGMKPITIEVRIKRLMAKTMAAATAPTPRTTEEVNANVAEWKALGVDAVKEEPKNYPYAACSDKKGLNAAGFNFYANTIENDVCLASFDTFTHRWVIQTSALTFPRVQVFKADLPSLTNGSYMFAVQENGPYTQQSILTTFTGELPNLINAYSMFSRCLYLTEWTVELPNSLTDARYMFERCSGLTSFSTPSGTLPDSLKEVSHMFYGCSGLKSWSVELPKNITDASQMFDGCSGLKSWTVELPSSLTNADMMFNGCSGLTSFSTPSGTLPDSLTNTSFMFQDCSGLTSWNVELPDSLTSISTMFANCTSLTSFTTPSGILSNTLSTVYQMFWNCGLTSWTVKLPDTLTIAYGMFQKCSRLTEWTVELPDSLTNAFCMFMGCTGLTSWSVELPDSLTDVGYMFDGCTGLREFTPSLAGLTNCVFFEGMFQGCILNEASIRKILGTLPDRTDETELTISIGGDATMEQSVKDDLSSLAESVSSEKNWTIALAWNTPPTE